MATSSLAIAEQLLNKLILKSEVVLPTLAAVATHKIAQKVTNITPLPHNTSPLSCTKTVQTQQKILSSNSKQNTNQDRWKQIRSKLQAGESAFRRNEYQSALKEYNMALDSLSQLKSIEYYRVLTKKASYIKKLRQADQLFKVYSELSLLPVGN